MDFNALQHKLFAMDPTDPKADLAKLRAQAGGNAPAPEAKVDYIAESANVPEGSLQMDRDYSVSDFAALAGIRLDEKQKTGSAGQAKGKDPMPKTSTPSRTGEQPHPLKDKLVGEADDDAFTTAIDKSFGQGSIAKKIGFSPTGELYKAIYRAIKAIMPDASEQEIKKAATAAATSMEESVNERSLTKGEVKKRDKTASKIMDKPKAKKSIASWAKDKGMDPEGAVYAIATNMAKKNKSTQTASLDTSDIKNRLYDALNKKMGL